MSVLIRVEDEPPRARLDYFRHVVADTIVPFGLRIVAADENLRAQILTGRVGPVHVAKVSAPPMKAFRTRKLIRVSDPELLKIDVQVRGRTVFAQGDREAALAPGDFTLVDLSRPCQLVDRDDEHEVLAVMFPRTLLPLPPNELARLTAVRMRGDQGGALVSSLARLLPGHLDDYGEVGGARVGTAMLDLLTGALAARLGRDEDVPRESRQRALLLRVRAFIEERLGDPDLSPGGIAAAHYISVRYLYKLFEAEEVTVAGWIRLRRLERCRRDLLDPTLADWPVSAIGARWGLTDAAHFSRAFRATYGLPPAEFRLATSSNHPR